VKNCFGCCFVGCDDWYDQTTSTKKFVRTKLEQRLVACLMFCLEGTTLAPKRFMIKRKKKKKRVREIRTSAIIDNFNFNQTFFITNPSKY